MTKDIFEKVRNKQIYQSKAESFSNREYSSILGKLEAIEQTELETLKVEYNTVSAWERKSNPNKKNLLYP